jgi:hypothetical protein
LKKEDAEKAVLQDGSIELKGKKLQTSIFTPKSARLECNNNLFVKNLPAEESDQLKDKLEVFLSEIVWRMWKNHQFSYPYRLQD